MIRTLTQKPTSPKCPNRPSQANHRLPLTAFETHSGRSIFAAGTALPAPLRSSADAARIGSVGWIPALGNRGFHRPLSGPSTDLQVRCHGSERDGRDVPIPDHHRRGACAVRERSRLRLKRLEQLLGAFEIRGVPKPSVNNPILALLALTLPAALVGSATGIAIYRRIATSTSGGRCCSCWSFRAPACWRRRSFEPCCAPGRRSRLCVTVIGQGSPLGADRPPPFSRRVPSVRHCPTGGRRGVAPAS